MSKPGKNLHNQKVGAETWGVLYRAPACGADSSSGSEGHWPRIRPIDSQKHLLGGEIKVWKLARLSRMDAKTRCTIAFLFFVEFNESKLRFHTYYKLRSFAHAINKNLKQKMGVMIHDCIRGRVDVGEGLPSARPWKPQSLEVQGSATWPKKDLGKLTMVNEMVNEPIAGPWNG